MDGVVLITWPPTEGRLRSFSTGRRAGEPWERRAGPCRLPQVPGKLLPGVARSLSSITGSCLFWQKAAKLVMSSFSSESSRSSQEKQTNN